MRTTATPSRATAARAPPPTACWCAPSLMARVVEPNGVRPVGARHPDQNHRDRWRARTTLREALSECGRAATALVFVQCRGSAWQYGVDAPVVESGSSATDHTVHGFAAALRKRAGPAVKAPTFDLNLRQPSDHCPAALPHAVTCHSSQGATADRVLVHVDTEQAPEELTNSRLAHVAVSRGRYDALV
jgi:hypothetical protein